MSTKTSKKAVMTEPAVPAAVANTATPRRAVRKSAEPAEPIGPIALSTPVDVETPTVKATQRKAPPKLATPQKNTAAPDAAVRQAAPVAAGAVPALVLKPLAALGLEEGLFVLVAASVTSESVETIARYVEEPLPHLVAPLTSKSWLDKQTVGNAVVYVAYVPWPQPPAGPVKLGCITTGGRRPVFEVDCLAWRSTKPALLATVLQRFGRLLMPAFAAVLPAAHPLRRGLAMSLTGGAPQLRSNIQGTFDGLVDGLAHGWVWNPAAPSERLGVEVLHEGEVVGYGTADRFRDDLKANGIGDGQHHFRLALSYELFDGKTHEITAREQASGITLAGAPVTVVFEPTQPKHVDCISRREGLQLLQALAAGSARNARRLQVLQQSFRQASLQQETWLLDGARARYEDLAKALGANALCHCKVAETWLLDRRLDQALEAYEAALESDPDFVWAHLGLGNVLRLQGRVAEASKAYRTALNLEPGHAAVRRRLDQVHSQTLTEQARQAAASGDKTGAIALLKAVVLEQPDNESACTELDELLREKDGSSSHAEALPESVLQAARARRLLDAVLDHSEHLLRLGRVTRSY